jgi:hypothetical protein
MVKGSRVGEVTHYYNRIGVAVLDLERELKVGHKVVFLGRITDFSQVILSMEVEHQRIQLANPGMEVALKVAERVRKGDEIFFDVED